jgi:serine/threonine-protein kinase
MAGVSAPLADLLRDRYTIERELGQGGMAVVYRTWDLARQQPVALKVLRPGLVASLGPERFLREIRLTARLIHQRILSLLDSGNAGGQLWFTMPYIDGETLRERLNRDLRLPVDEAVRLTREIAEAVEHAHGHGIVHRDIKPENILMAEGGPLVADFGIAKALGEAAGSRLTETGLIIGTAAYMSPEQAAGDPIDARTDIYSLGCVLYEMLAGEPPFAGPTGHAMIARRMAGPPRNLRIVRPDAPVEVDQAVQRALAPEPEDRFECATEFARALTEPVVNEAVPPPRLRPSGRVTEGGTAVMVAEPIEPQPAVTDHRTAVLVLVLVLGAVALLVLAIAWMIIRR